MSILAQLRGLLQLGRGTVLGLPELTAADDPIVFFADWFRQARQAGLFLPETMALATADAEGSPAVRMVLLKGFDDRGFVFYTNYGSRKGEELAANPRAALCLHWNVLQRQVRIEGRVEKVSREESKAYFASRPLGSRIGAVASKQSATLENRRLLEERYRELQRELGDEVPLPEFWGGYRVAAERMEFWQGRADRLHDRFEYTRQADGGWRVRRLYP